ncbi:MAG: alanyl-tRNA editing protein [Methanomicrobia archaeon]|nr:alanyl-tRNA editing protein [Methanomicrobia archaeon]HDM22709.1 alanyl-tRNA editing protein [Methanomicrobia archaeon]
MDTKLLFLEDAYRKEFEASVLKYENGYAILDQTCFYPRSGGQECDKGIIERDGEIFNVSEVKKEKGTVLHKINGVLNEGDKVSGKIDWDRRYKMMKYHTALHILSRVIFDMYGGGVTGNDISPNRARMDFDLEKIEDKEEIEKRTNEIIKEGRDVKIYTVPREEAEKLVDEKTRLDMIPHFVKEIRLVEIENFDIDACGGTHVKNTKEIGEIKITKIENKGKGRKRIVIV